MDLQLSGKRVLVTGSTAGIGLAIAQTLAGEGPAAVAAGAAQGVEPEARRGEVELQSHRGAQVVVEAR